MAWVKMINKAGDILDVPEPVYLNMFKDNGAYSLIKNEPKPSLSKEKEIKTVEVKKEDGLQEHKSNEREYYRKSAKASSN